MTYSTLSCKGLILCSKFTRKGNIPPIITVRLEEFMLEEKLWSIIRPFHCSQNHEIPQN